MPHEADLALIEGAAREAGAAAMGFFGKDLRHWEKPGEAGPVSDADLAANAILRERLLAARPELGWLSEEDADDAARLQTAVTAIVDPIDGTRAFIEGKPGFAVAVALVADGRPVAAVVHLPAREETFTATAGGGAHRDGRPIAASPVEDPENADVLAASASLKPEHWPGGVPELRRHFRSSLAWRLCLVAEGAFDALITIRDCHEWDIAAGALIAEEAGVRVTDRDGAPMRFNNPKPRIPGMIVAPPALHEALLKRRR